MIKTKELKTREDFESLKNGDMVACEFHRDVSDFPAKYRFNIFRICLNKKESSEIILKKKNNIYFNYDMFLNPEIGRSNLKSIVLISSVDKQDAPCYQMHKDWFRGVSDGAGCEILIATCPHCGDNVVYNQGCSKCKSEFVFLRNICN